MPELNLNPPEEINDEGALEPNPCHPIWSGSISIGLVNIPVRAIPVTVDRKIRLRMVHMMF